MNTAATAPALPVAATASAAMPVVERFSASDTEPGVYYRTAQTWNDPCSDVPYGLSCSCKAFAFGGGKPCKHLRREWAAELAYLARMQSPAPARATFGCIVCPGRALAGGLYCRDCQDARYAVEMARVNDAADLAPSTPEDVAATVAIMAEAASDYLGVPVSLAQAAELHAAPRTAAQLNAEACARWGLPTTGGRLALEHDPLAMASGF